MDYLLFSPSDKWKKLSHPILLHLLFGTVFCGYVCPPCKIPGGVSGAFKRTHFHMGLTLENVLKLSGTVFFHLSIGLNKVVVQIQCRIRVDLKLTSAKKKGIRTSLDSAEMLKKML